MEPPETDKLAQAATELELVETASTASESGVRLRTHTGLKVDLRIVAPTSSATCSSTSPAPSSTTWRCARRRCARACTSPSTACSTTAPARRTAARARRRSTRCSGCEYIEPELRENRGELEAAANGTLPAADRRRRPARRPALPHHRLRRHGLDRGDGAGGPRRRLRVPRDHRPLATSVGGAHRPGAAARATSRGSGASDRRVGGISCWPAARSTSSPTARWTTTTRCSAELDWVVASVHSSFRMDSAAMTARIVRAIVQPAGGRHRAPLRAQDRAPRAVPLRLPSDRSRPPQDRHDAGDQLQPRPPRHERGQRPRRRRRRASRSSSTATRTGSVASRWPATGWPRRGGRGWGPTRWSTRGRGTRWRRCGRARAPRCAPGR